MHFAPAIYLIVPWFQYLPSMHLLVIFAVIFLCLSGLVFYLTFYKSLGKFAAFLIVFSYLFHQSIYTLAVKDIFLYFFLPFFFCLAFYFYDNKKFFFFALSLVLCLSARQDIALSVMMFGFYALLNKRSKPWFFYPLALGVVVAIFQIKVSPLLFKPVGRFSAVDYLAFNRNSLGDFIVFCVKNPQEVINYICTLDKLRYLFLLVLPAGIILPFFSWEFILGIPIVLVNLLASINYTWAIENHYSSLIALFLFFSAAKSLAKIANFLHRKHKINKAKFVKVITLILFFISFINFMRSDLYGWTFGKTLYMPYYNLSSNREYMINATDLAHNQALREALNLINDNKSVYMPRYLLVYKSELTLLREVNDRTDPGHCDLVFDYILIDSNTKDSYTKRGYDNDFIKNIDSNSMYKLIYNKHGVKLYQLAED